MPLDETNSSNTQVDEGKKDVSTLTLAHFDEDIERLIQDDYQVFEGYNQTSLWMN